LENGIEYIVACDRSNLDPFERHTDRDLWDVLEKCSIKNKVSISAN